MSHDQQPKPSRGRGIGTVIACFVGAIVIAGILDNDEPQVRRAEAQETGIASTIERKIAAAERKAAAAERKAAAAERQLASAEREASAAEREPASADSTSDRASYRINQGHIIIEPTTGEMKIDMSDEVRQHTQVKTNGQRVSIMVDDDYEDDVKIKISVPSAAACRIELAAGLLEVKRPPCQNNELTVRSGKMDVDNVPQNHGALSGWVNVGTVTIKGDNGKESKSSGVGELKADLPAAGNGPTITARVNVGMLTIDVD